MKKTLIALALVAFISSCSTSVKNKVEGSEAQSVDATSSTTGTVYSMNKEGSIINWVGSKIAGGSHNGTVSLSDAKIVADGENFVSASFTIDMNTIVDLDLTDAKMNEMLVGHLKNSDFFDVEKYPTAQFVTTKVEKVATDSVTHMISGNLKIKDVEKNITFGVKISKDGDVYKASTVPFTIDRTQWNVTYGSKSIFADLKDNIISDNIEIQINLEGQAVK